MTGGRLLHCVVIGVLTTVLALQSSGVMGAPSVDPRSGPTHLPPAALLLAQRLGISSQPVVGDQANGMGRPWAVWFPRTIKPGWVGAGNIPKRYLPLVGPALFVGPRGAQGQFHYFNPGPIRTSDGNDAYHGPPLTRAHGIRLAYAWLQAIGVPIPRGSPYIQIRSGMTVIGGTGLCCYRSLAVLSWGGKPDASGMVWSARETMYVADAGTVVEADFGPLTPSSTDGLSQPCPGRSHADANGIVQGQWCFGYAGAVWRMIIGEIGNHGPWVDDPNEMADIGAAYVRRGSAALKDIGRSRRVLLTAHRAVYVQSYKGVLYRMTFVPAFPSLPGSIWELVRVQRAR